MLQWFLIACLFLVVCHGSLADPVMDTSTSHVTALEGTTVVLPCVISSLGRHKVGWMKGNGVVLTMDSHRIVDDTRLLVTRNTVNDWDLNIQNTQSTDSGTYNCAVNTSPVKSKTVILTVEAPPRIVASTSNLSRHTVEEGDNVTLHCTTIGVPKPLVQWYTTPEKERHDGREHECRYVTEDEHNMVLSPFQDLRERQLGSGEFLKIVGVSRYCGGMYQCVASNNLPPDQDKSFEVVVDFAPEVNILNTRISQSMGKETILECDVQAHPHGTVHWTKNHTKLSNSPKHVIEAYSGDDKTQMTLSIRFKVSEKMDFGEYMCEAANEHGSHQASVHLLEYILPASQPDKILPKKPEIPTPQKPSGVTDEFTVPLSGSSARASQERSSHSDSISLGYSDKYEGMEHRHRISSASSNYDYNYDMASATSFSIPKVVVWGLVISNMYLLY